LAAKVFALHKALNDAQCFASEQKATILLKS